MDGLISYIKNSSAFVMLTLPYIVGWGEFLVWWHDWHGATRLVTIFWRIIKSRQCVSSAKKSESTKLFMMPVCSRGSVKHHNDTETKVLTRRCSVSSDASQSKNGLEKQNSR